MYTNLRRNLSYGRMQRLRNVLHKCRSLSCLTSLLHPRTKVYFYLALHYLKRFLLICQNAVQCRHCVKLFKDLSLLGLSFTRDVHSRARPLGPTYCYICIWRYQRTRVPKQSSGTGHFVFELVNFPSYICLWHSALRPLLRLLWHRLIVMRTLDFGVSCPQMFPVTAAIKS